VTELPALAVSVRGPRVLLVEARRPHGQPILEALPYPILGDIPIVAAAFARRVNGTSALVEAARHVLKAYAKTPHELTPDLKAWLFRLHELTKEIDPR